MPSPTVTPSNSKNSLNGKSRNGSHWQNKPKIAARAQERYAREKAEFDETMNKREAKEKESGKEPGGKPPTTSEPGAKDSDQINLTDEESRIMPVAGGGFEQCNNAQAGVDADTMLMVATTLTQAPNDKQTVEPVIGSVKSVMGFRQFSMRGLRKVAGDWNLVGLAWNVKRMAVLRPTVG